MYWYYGEKFHVNHFWELKGEMVIYICLAWNKLHNPSLKPEYILMSQLLTKSQAGFQRLRKYILQ